MKYEVLEIQLLFLSTQESQLLPEPQQHLDSSGSDSFCQFWKEFIWVLPCPKMLLKFPRFVFILRDSQ